MQVWFITTVSIMICTSDSFNFLLWAYKLKKQSEVIKALHLRPVDRGSLLAATAAVAAATNTTTAQLLVSPQLVVALRTDKGWRVSLLTARFF